MNLLKTGHWNNSSRSFISLYSFSTMIHSWIYVYFSNWLTMSVGFVEPQLLTNLHAETKSESGYESWNHTPQKRKQTKAKLPQIVLRNTFGRKLDTYTAHQEAIYQAKQNVKQNNFAWYPEEWRLPGAPVPARPDYTRHAPIPSHVRRKLKPRKQRLPYCHPEVYVSNNNMRICKYINKYTYLSLKNPMKIHFVVTVDRLAC